MRKRVVRRGRHHQAPGHVGKLHNGTWFVHCRACGYHSSWIEWRTAFDRVVNHVKIHHTYTLES